MTQILITGGGGFIGQKLAQRLASDGTLAGREIAGMKLVDLSVPLAPAARTRSIVSVRKLAAPRPEFAVPPRNRACSTSPVPAPTATSGWYPRTWL